MLLPWWPLLCLVSYRALLPSPRMLRIAQRIDELRVLVDTIVTSLSNVTSIFLVLFLLIFVFACVGMSIFGR